MVSEVFVVLELSFFQVNHNHATGSGDADMWPVIENDLDSGRVNEAFGSTHDIFSSIGPKLVHVLEYVEISEINIGNTSDHS